MARVSVVVPTRDRLSSLRRALESLQRQQGAAPGELIVVDDGSTDGTAAFLRELASAGAIVHVEGPGKGAAAARNAGMRHATGEVVAFTDDDCEAPPDWVARLGGRIVETGASAVGGRVVAAPDASRPARLSQAITNGIARALNAKGPGAAFLTANNVAYRAAVLRAAGGFDERFAGAGGEERELHERLRARGERLVYAPDIVVEHRPPLGWAGFLRQQVGYGRGARLHFRTGRGARGLGPRHLSAAQYLRAFAAALTEAQPADRVALAVGLPLSQAAVAWGYLRGPRA